jgi:hypothetical protein
MKFGEGERGHESKRTIGYLEEERGDKKGQYMHYMYVIM